MNKPTKIYWKIRNKLESIYKSAKGGTGLLSHRVDIRDKVGVLFSTLQKKLGTATQKSASLNYSKYYFDQENFNICVFASFVMLISNQSGIRFSVRWLVKLARREGYISGNGWSFLKAALKCAYKYGLIPYELMPDEINGMSWENYSKWTKSDNALLDIAKKYKIPEYSQITKQEQLVAEMEAGHLIYTALDWYSAMNRPNPPEFILIQGGSKVGGHAIYLAGQENYYEKLLNPQTFGRSYGRNGDAFIKNIFTRGFYAAYVIDDIDFQARLEHFQKFYDGKMVKVKGTIECYFIKDGFKFPVSTTEDYFLLKEKLGDKGVDENVKKDMLDNLPTSFNFNFNLL